MARFLLVGNPTAQSGKNNPRIHRARKAFESAGAACDFVPTQPEGKTIPAVRHVLDHGGYDVVVSMGGDGTFREVGSAILDSARREEVQLAMLPTGTANDQGRSFGLSSDPSAIDRNVAVALARRETRLDAGRLTAKDTSGNVLFSSYFFDSAGWGLMARALARRNNDRRVVERVPIVRELWRDQALYATAAIATFLESYIVSDKFAVRGTVDGAPMRLTRLSDLVIKNTRVYAGAWVLDRTSAHDDGYFEAIPFRGRRDWTSKILVDLDGNPLTEERLNLVGVQHSKPFRFQRLELAFRAPRGAAPIAAQMDGEEVPLGPRTTVEVLPRVLRLIVP
ncbi:MAG: diacylglycerol kinase family protein [Polyangiaceae bacterium]